MVYDEEVYPYAEPGRLAQTGTLDATVPGRAKVSLGSPPDGGAQP